MFVILPIIVHVIRHFRPFRSISYGYDETHFFKFLILTHYRFALSLTVSEKSTLIFLVFKFYTHSQREA